MAKVSVIIPVHNGADYILNCLNSITEQTIGIKNLEVIVVNDGSTDDTNKAIELWEEKYPENIIIVNLAHSVGVGAARNIGLQYVSTDYIGFVDSDDYIEHNMYEQLYNKMVENECDLVVCQSKKHKLDDSSSVFMGRTKVEDALLIINSDDKRIEFLNIDINQAVWNKLYSKYLLINNEITFPEGFIYEDVYFTELVKNYANKIYILEEYLYHYVIRKESVSNNTVNWKKRLHRFWVEELKLEELKRRGIYQPYKNYYDNEYVITYITVIKNFIKTYGVMNKDLLQEINQIVVNRYPDYKDIPLIKKLLNSSPYNFYNHLLTGLGLNIDDIYIERLNTLAQ